MANNYFSFRQFTVFQDQCAMKVGTDGVLLGAWTDVEGTSRILDIGSGTGLIALMLAQRSAAEIDGVELEKNACLQSRKNVAGSPWYHRINVYHDSIRHFSETTTLRYDVIVSNPPFFRNSLRPPANSRSVAKHDVDLTYETLLLCASKLLMPGGRFSVILPAGEQKYFSGLADFHRLNLVRLTRVRPAPGKEFSRCLMEFSGLKGRGCREDELVIRKDDLKAYSEEYRELTKEYYLN